MKYKIIQTCDATSDYIKLFNLSSMVNKEYCKKWNYEYDSFIGLKKGYHSWHAVFNRIYMLNECIEENIYDWIIYLDVDAFIVDFNISFDDIIKDEQNKDKALLLMGFGEKHNNMCINTGVLFINIKHTKTKYLINNWKTTLELVISDEALQASKEPWSIKMNNVIIDDQVLLSMIFFLLDELKLTDTMIYRYLNNQGILNNSFIQQVMRPNKGIDGTFVSYRVQLMRANIEKLIQRYNLNIKI
jgi:hypothetical protein